MEDDQVSSSNISQFFRSSKVSNNQKKKGAAGGGFISTIMQNAPSAAKEGDNSSKFRHSRATLRSALQMLPEDESISSHSLDSCSSDDHIVDKVLEKLAEGGDNPTLNKIFSVQKEELLAEISDKFKAQMEKQKEEHFEIINYLEN